MTDRTSQEGFSLIEVLVAIALFTVGLLAIASLQVHSIRYSSGANVRTSTVAVAQGVMEEILAFRETDPRFASSVAGMAWDFDTSDGDVDPLVIPGGGTYNVTWDVATNTPITDIAQITVTVNGPQGRVVTLTGYKRFL